MAMKPLLNSLSKSVLSCDGNETSTKLPRSVFSCDINETSNKLFLGLCLAVMSMKPLLNSF